MFLIMKKGTHVFLVLITLGFVFGCAAHKHAEIMNPATGSLNAEFLEKEVFDEDQKIKDDVDVIYLLELGGIYSAKGDFKKSNRVLEAAKNRYTAREEEASLSARTAGSKTMDVLLAEGSRDYELADYEKVYLHTVKCMNFLMLGDKDRARVETMAAVERHKMIKDYIEFETAQMKKAEQEVQRKSRKTSNYKKVIPQMKKRADLNSQLKHKISSLKNSYENSFTYVLSALNLALLEGESNVGQKLGLAINLTENQYVRELGTEYEKTGGLCTNQGSNLYVFAQVGSAPVKKNLTIPFPNPISQTTCQFCIARIEPTPLAIGSVELACPTGVVGQLDKLTDMELLPLKEYDNKLPENLSKAALRVIAQTMRDRVIMGVVDEQKNIALSSLTKLALGTVNKAIAKADTRTWITAPKSVLFYSGRFSGTELIIHVKDKSGKIIKTTQVQTDPEKINVINLRCFDHETYVQSQRFVAKSTRVPQHKDDYTIADKPGNSATETARRSDRTGVSPSAWKEAPPDIKPASISPKPVYEQKGITPEITNDPYTTPDEPGKSVAQPPHITTTSRELTFSGTELIILVKDKSGNIIKTTQFQTDPEKINVISLRSFDYETYVQSQRFVAKSTRVPQNKDDYTIANKPGKSVAQPLHITTTSREPTFMPQEEREPVIHHGKYGTPAILMPPKKEPKTTHKMRIHTNPPGASVSLNGEFMGKTGEKALIIDGLNPDKYFVKVEKEGYTPAGSEISLVKSQTFFISLNKRPIPKRHILVETIPVGADVYVDSILCGKTGEEGLKIEKLTPEVHFLTIKKKPHFKTVEIELSLEDKSKVVKIRMKPLR